MAQEHSQYDPTPARLLMAHFLLLCQPFSFAFYAETFVRHPRCCPAPAVTFVALGNGAPDLSSNINAIRSGNVLLSAGALTGRDAGTSVSAIATK